MFVEQWRKVKKNCKEKEIVSFIPEDIESSSSNNDDDNESIEEDSE